MTLQEIKDQYAKEYIGHENATWGQFKAICLEPLEDHMHDIARRYALECCKASLEKAAENLTKTQMDQGYSFISQPAITNAENIVLP